jgi:hypothetical protein
VNALFRETHVAGAALLVPLPPAVGGWGEQVRGMAVSAALVREVERIAHSAGLGMFIPIRWTLDLLRPCRNHRFEVRGSVVRQGRRIAVIQVELAQSGTVTARGTALYTVAGSQSAGDQGWTSDDAMDPPPAMPGFDGGEGRVFFSPGAGWSAQLTDHQNARPKTSWHTRRTVVEGEEPTPFQFVAGVADVTNLVTHWGARGLEHINADVSLHLARLPRGAEVGLKATFRQVVGGVAIGGAAVHDRDGCIGLAVVSSLDNHAHAVDVAGWKERRAIPGVDSQE